MSQKAKRTSLTSNPRPPYLWTVIAFVSVVIMATILSVWWNVLLVQNHRILEEMTAVANAAAQDPARANLPLALMMVLGLLCFFVIVLGLFYLFLKLIKTLQLNIAQNQFIASVTHELRSPVASLRVLLETIRDPTTPSQTREEFQEIMDLDLKRLSALVDQVLDTAKIENSFLAAREVISIGPVLKACQENIQSRLTTTSSHLKICQVGDDLTVVGNRRLLTTALVNILENSIKYSKGQAEIRIDVWKAKKRVVLEVSDNGIGILPQEQKKIFRRFYRSGDALTQSQPGTGLGLYFTKLAIKAQGGKISVKSRGLGFGSVFRIELPR